MPVAAGREGGAAAFFWGRGGRAAAGGFGAASAAAAAFAGFAGLAGAFARDGFAAVFFAAGPAGFVVFFFSTIGFRSALRDFDEMPDFADHSPDRRGIVPNHLHAETAEAEPLERRLLILRSADAAPDQGDGEPALRSAVLARLRLFGRLARVGHAFSSVGSAVARPRRFAISSSFFK